MSRQSEQWPLPDGARKRTRVVWDGKVCATVCPLLPWLSGERKGTIINGSEHLLTKPGEVRLWSFCLCFSPQVPLVSGKSHHPAQRCRASMTCSIWAFSPARTCDKRMKCSFPPLLKCCSPACYELDSQAEYLPLWSAFITNNHLVLPY